MEWGRRRAATRIALMIAVGIGVVLVLGFCAYELFGNPRIREKTAANKVVMDSIADVIFDMDVGQPVESPREVVSYLPKESIDWQEIRSTAGKYMYGRESFYIVSLSVDAKGNPTELVLLARGQSAMYPHMWCKYTSDGAGTFYVEYTEGSTFPSSLVDRVCS